MFVLKNGEFVTLSFAWPVDVYDTPIMQYRILHHLQVPKTWFVVCIDHFA